MTLLINKIISSISQIILFAALPIIWWFFLARKQQTFWQWIGLKKMENSRQTRVLYWIIGVSLAFMTSGILILYMIKDVETATSEFTGLGIQAIPAVFVYAVFNTSFPEELLFRGFLLKRISGKFNFPVANTIQAALFGLLHGVMFFSLTGALKAILIVVFTGIIAYVMGYINEKKANGSIIPGWIIHAASNLLSGICSAFLII